jgi:hypothetical protein
MSATRRTHRALGLLMLLPICGWALTGFVFFIKPGYGPAYGALQVRRYALDGAPVPSPQPDWLEMKLVRTVLGDHLLVRRETGPEQLDPATLSVRELPDQGAIRRLIADAIAPDTTVYGDIAVIELHDHDGDTPSASIQTTTGVEIDLHWPTLTLQQSGRDTRRIDALYRVHYLQWTGIGPVDRVLGVVGLLALSALAIFGLRLAFRYPSKTNNLHDRSGERPHPPPTLGS